MSFATACVLSYQRPQFLKDCVGTLLSAGAPLELIVHDDGSDPEVQELLAEWVRERVVSTVILNPPGHNQGQGVALNRMFNMAKGDPIIKLDQDLIFHPGWLARVQELLMRNAVEELREREPLIGLLGLMHYWLDPVDSAKTSIGQHHGWSARTHILGSAFAVTRHCWNTLGPFEEHYESFGEDWQFQKKVTASHHFACGLPDEDLVVNQGFGIGPSTVVVAENTVASIHKEPVIHGAQ